MLPAAPCNVDFFDWLDTLDNDEHHAVLEHLRRIAEELGIRVDRKPFIAHKFFDLAPNVVAVLSRN
jgi:hypothetical protein